MAGAGGGSGKWGEVEINQQSTPTVQCLWGVEPCIYVAELGGVRMAVDVQLDFVIDFIYFCKM